MTQIDGVHVVTMLGEGSYKLEEEQLRLIMMNEDVQDLPVALVSIAGAFRSGKSFLLNFLLRYLNASKDARKDGSWLENGNKPLDGFSWRGGSERNTTGILMWPQPFFVETSEGEKVAIFLMDTQGTFDSTSTVRDCSTIFALSTLVASSQIYNISEYIKENDLQSLQLFTNYGKLMKDKSGKAFQELDFLIRNWANDEEYAYGQKGGNEYLLKLMSPNPTQPKELQDIRTNIISSFDKVTCFLMPHPGLIVGKRKFTGRLSEIDDDFKIALKELANSIFSPDKITKKKIYGQAIKCRELFQYFKNYMSIFNSDKLPEPKTIFTLTSETGMLMAYDEAREQYEHNMKLACGTDAPSMTVMEVVKLHQNELKAATSVFESKELMGDEEVLEQKLHELTEELEGRQKEYMEINSSKTLRARNRGLEAYTTAIKEASPSGFELICVHASDVRKIQDYAVESAMTAFDLNRKVVSGQIDVEREHFLKELNSKYKILKMTNNQNNFSAANEIQSEYFQTMVLKCTQEPKLGNEAFEEEHKKALAAAISKYDGKRTGNDDILKIKYTEDTFKYNLEQDLLFKFELVKQINKSNNSGSFQIAIASFQASRLSPSQLRQKCFHPHEMSIRHEQAVCAALQAYRKEAVECKKIKFNEKDKDESLLHKLFENFCEFDNQMNNTANEKAEEIGFMAFRKKFDILTDYWYYYIFGIGQSTRKEYLNEAQSDGLDAFYEKRYDRGNHGYDSYESSLKSRCKSYAKVRD